MAEELENRPNEIRQDEIPPIEYRHIEARWADRLEALELRTYPTVSVDDLYTASELARLAAEFPEGNFVALDGGEPIAMGLGIRVHFDLSEPQHTLSDLTGHHGGGTGHVPDGEWYYGTDISVDIRYRRRGIGQRLYELRKQCCLDLGLLGIVAGGVLPGYADHKHQMSAADYVAKVAAGDFHDSTLSFQLENGFEVRGVLENYVEDPTVDNWASLIVWPNPELETP